MKLGPNQIHFIDTYLLNSDVIYKDVRAEMVDHVASAIEQKWIEEPNKTFREVFKNYMIENKKQLLDDFNAFKKQITKRLFLELGKTTLTPLSILIGILVFVLLNYVQNTFSINMEYLYEYWKALSLSVVIVLTLIWYLSKRYIVKQSYIAIEQLMWVLVFLNYGANFIFDIVINLFFETYKTTLILTITAFYVVVFISFIKILRDHIVRYKNKYQIQS